MKLTGGEIVTEYLIREGIPYVVGIPGHGCLGLVDAFRKYKDKLSVIQVRHEQSASHLADGYYRALGKPLAVFTSIGPGAINTAVGVATSYVDSTAMLVITGGTHTYMKGRGVLQEVGRKRWTDNIQIFEPITKAYFRVENIETLPFVLERAFAQMLTGRPGPVVIELPMDIQSEEIEIELDVINAEKRRANNNRIRGDSSLIEKTADLLYKSKKPVILAGGGVIASSAEQELKELAEFLGAPVVTTMMGKGAFPEDHPLYAWHTGSKGTICGNSLTNSADVILAVGCRFADETCSSYRSGVSFFIPPTKLVQIDIDPNEVGKNYPVEVGIIGDAKSVMSGLLEALKELGLARDFENSSYFENIQRAKAMWFQSLEAWHNNVSKDYIIISRCLKVIREALPKETIVVTSSGNSQAQIFQEIPFYEPRTHITTGGFSTMGFGFPASLGVKLARPDRPVVAVVGDGDFLMTIQELATAVQYEIPVTVIVVNNSGWQSIADLQESVYGKESVFATHFLKKDGQDYLLNFAKIAESFGAWGKRVEREEEIAQTIKKALSVDGPAVVDIKVSNIYPYSGGLTIGEWDVPVPEYLKEAVNAG